MPAKEDLITEEEYQWLQKEVQHKVDSGELTWYKLARNMGYLTPDVRRVQRDLSYKLPPQDIHNKKTVTLVKALKLARAAGIHSDDLEF